MVSGKTFNVGSSKDSDDDYPKNQVHCHQGKECV